MFIMRVRTTFSSGSKALSGCCLEHEPGPVHADPVFPLRTRVEEQRQAQGFAGGGGDIRGSAGCDVVVEGVVEESVAEAGCVQQQVSGGDVASWGAQGRRGVIGGVEHLQFFEFWQVDARGCVEVELTAVVQDQRQGGGDRFGQGEQG